MSDASPVEVTCFSPWYDETYRSWFATVAVSSVEQGDLPFVGGTKYRLVPLETS